MEFNITSLLQKFKLRIGSSMKYYPSYSKMKSWNMKQMHISMCLNLWLNFDLDRPKKLNQKYYYNK
jgi:hypothetical protein